MMRSNDEIADLLDRTATLLEHQDANRYRVQSYRRAAETIRSLNRPLAEIYQSGGKAAIERVENIGEKLAGSIAEIVETGRLGLLDRLESQESPEEVFARLPGIGPALARRLHQELEVDTMEELEQAAHDGRLEQVEGIGKNKAKGIRDTLAGMLSRSARRSSEKRSEMRPPVELLLEADKTYRRKAEKNELRKIAPKRFNPENRAWLPIMETEKDGWHFTVLYSNTKRAHDLDKVKDWVVIYYRKNSVENQCTVVTSNKGDLAGKRVVRGRESECRRSQRSGPRGPGFPGCIQYGAWQVFKPRMTIFSVELIKRGTVNYHRPGKSHEREAFHERYKTETRMPGMRGHRSHQRKKLQQLRGKRSNHRPFPQSSARGHGARPSAPALCPASSRRKCGPCGPP
ncbi:MAG: hypothetical protein K9K88_17590 [Desulfobacterales bacterium]|nr:hypothetical protein [Desulfobacterales bacterium]